MSARARRRGLLRCSNTLRSKNGFQVKLFKCPKLALAMAMAIDLSSKLIKFLWDTIIPLHTIPYHMPHGNGHGGAIARFYNFLHNIYNS